MGIVFSTLFPNNILVRSTFPKPSKFLPSRDIPPLDGTVSLVTGGNVGIGYETAKQLLLKNQTVWIACRSAERGNAAIEKLKAETGGKTALLLLMDLADLKSVRKAAEEFLDKEKDLAVLYCNAGVMMPPLDQLTAQNYDQQIGTNLLGHYLLIQLLIPALRSYHTTTSIPGRIVHTSSYGHNFAPPPTGIEFTSLKGGPERDDWIKKWAMKAPVTLYGQSKLGQILLSNHIAKMEKGKVLSAAVHPGVIQTELSRHSSAAQKAFYSRLYYPVSFGALAQLWAGTIATPEEVNGKYVLPGAVVGPSSEQSTNVETEETLVRWMEEQVKGF